MSTNLSAPRQIVYQLNLVQPMLIVFDSSQLPLASHLPSMPQISTIAMIWSCHTSMADVGMAARVPKVVAAVWGIPRSG